MALNAIDDCLTCSEGMAEGECPKSKRTCGHHCNCSWIQDCCHWCGIEIGEDGTEGGQDLFTDLAS
jgi:hypothetical protein